MITLSLDTPDGPCPTTVFRPRGEGPFPGVIFVIDGFGPRPSLFAMAESLAQRGYVVALPDLFHRAGSLLELLPPGSTDVTALVPLVLGDPNTRARWRERFYASATDPKNVEADMTAVLAFFASDPSVRPGPVGVVGYCMGGGIALRTAAIFGEKIGAAAVFHGGMLATDAPDSPHLGAASIRARVLVAGAIEDPSFTEEMKARLVQAFEAARVTATVETYPARHGFAIPDLPTYDAQVAARHLEALDALLRPRSGGGLS